MIVVNPLICSYASLHWDSSAKDMEAILWLTSTVSCHSKGIMELRHLLTHLSTHCLSLITLQQTQVPRQSETTSPLNIIHLDFCSTLFFFSHSPQSGMPQCCGHGWVFNAHLSPISGHFQNSQAITTDRK